MAALSCVWEDRRPRERTTRATGALAVTAELQDAGPRVDATAFRVLPAGEDEYLYGVRSAGILSDGSVAVANGGRHEILIFDSKGELTRRIGRRGQGPGEFVGPSRMDVRPGDTLVVWDLQAQRVTRMQPDGTVLSVEMGGLGRIPTGLEDWAGAPDGTVFVTEVERESIPPPEGRSRPERALVRLGAEAFDTIAMFPGPEILYLDVGGPLRMPTTALFFADVHLAAGGNPWRLVVGDGASARFEVRDAAGELMRVMSWEAQRPALTATAVSAMRDARIRAEVVLKRRTPEYAARRIRQLPSPERAPVFRRLFVDDLGNVWAERYPAPSVPEGSWMVIDISQGSASHVRLPPGLIPLQVTEEVLVGLRRDSLDVETVGLYRVLRPEP